MACSPTVTMPNADPDLLMVSCSCGGFFAGGPQAQAIFDTVHRCEPQPQTQTVAS